VLLVLVLMGVVGVLIGGAREGPRRLLGVAVIEAVEGRLGVEVEVQGRLGQVRLVEQNLLL
jgi:hypothetical protein